MGTGESLMLEGNDRLTSYLGGSRNTPRHFMLQKSSSIGHWPDTHSLPIYLYDNVYYILFFVVIMKFMGDLPMSKHQKETEIVFNLLKVGVVV